MFLRLFILFVIVPIIELALLIEIGGLLGTVNTILLIFITGILGAALAKHEGLGVISRIREELGRGQIPPQELFDGFCILVGGLLLLTPGFLTDALGFSLLIPITRRGIEKYLRSKIEESLKKGPF
ncbi:MAG: FxsA family protein [bacterium]